MSNCALLTAVNEPLEIRDCCWTDLQFGQVLVKILASGICGAQLQEQRGEKGNHFPRLMGHEGVGIVQAIGEGVTQVKPQDKVCLHWRKGDGIESPSPTIDIRTGIITTGQVTTFSEYSIVSENRCTAVPMDTPDELVCLLGCSLSTALGTIESEAQLMMGESVLIIGCGGLGLNLILAAKMRQAGFIMGLDQEFTKGDAALSAGAHKFSLGAYVNRYKFDVVIDTTGNPDAIDLGIRALAPSGRFIMVGQPKPGVMVPINNARHLFDGEGCSIKATQGGRFNPSKDISRYVRLHQAGLLKLDGIISHKIPLSDINKGLDLVRDGLAGRVLITP